MTALRSPRSRTPRLGSLLFGLIALLCPLNVFALCIPKGLARPDTSDPFTYLSAVVDSLALVKQGRARVREGASDDLSDVLYRAKAGEVDYQCAASTLRPYADSSDEMIRNSSTMLARVYGDLAAANQALVGEIVGLLDQASKGQIPGQGAIVDRLASLRLMADETWKMVPLAVIGTTYTLPKFDQGKPTGHFRITNTQRQQLMRALEKEFGPSVRGGLRAGQHALDGAAGALYGYLADRNWRSVDDK